MIDPRTVPVRFSHLKLMAQSPAHYLHRIASAPGPQTPAMRRGSLVHALIAGQRPTVFEGTRRGAVWEAFRAEHGDDTYTASELTEAEPIALAVRRSPVVRSIISDADEIERTLSWDIDGRACQGTPDRYGARHIIDWKTCQSADPARFVWDIRRYHYAAQLVWYADAIGMTAPNLYVVAVESRAPYEVVVYRISERAIEAARATYRAWWERLMVCEASGEFPGYAQSVVDLDTEIEDDLDFDGIEAEQ